MIKGCTVCQYKDLKSDEVPCIYCSNCEEFKIDNKIIENKTVLNYKIGQEVKYNDKKFIIEYLRIDNEGVFASLISTCIVVPSLISIEHISPWTEPEKPQKAFFTFYDKRYKVVKLNTYAETKEKALEFCEKFNCDLVDWPADFNKIYDK